MPTRAVNDLLKARMHHLRKPLRACIVTQRRKDDDAPHRDEMRLVRQDRPGAFPHIILAFAF